MFITKWPCLVVLLSFCLAHCACQWRGAVGIRELADSNHIFTEHLLWTTVCQSRISCGIICLNDPSCVRFTVSENTKGKQECRGHSGQSTEEGQWSEGAVLYVLQTRTSVSSLTTQHQSLTTTSKPDTTKITENYQDFSTANEEDVSAENDQDFTTEKDQDFTTQNDQIYTTTGGTTWLSSACVDHKQCQNMRANSECFNKQCMCTPGYFYSLSTGHCLYNCSNADLQDTFQAYDGFMIDGFTLSKLSGFIAKLKSTSQCLDFCLNSSVICPSVNYYNKYSLFLCKASSVSRHDKPDNWKQDSAYVYYQRTCK
ncbi:uncharacterized protein [Littorina saxatilis]|uniref:Apple domain-containing protein n=1 Tax=Littorina saxatilis TaxID=31220 RepID=A0AAN9BGG2_9CAEN